MTTPNLDAWREPIYQTLRRLNISDPNPADYNEETAAILVVLGPLVAERDKEQRASSYLKGLQNGREERL